MKSLINRFLVAGLAGFMAFSISACGDSDSGSVVKVDNPDDEDVSSSSVKKSSSSSKKVSSSSSEKVSSSSSKNISSSSEKSEAKNSSSSEKASSSSKEVKPKSSSSSRSDSSSSKKMDSSSSLLPGQLSEGDMDRVTCVTEGLVTYYVNDDRKRVAQICHDGLWEIVESSSSSSDGHYVMDDQFNTLIKYSDFVDERDGQTYRTVVVDESEKFEIFAENLNYGKQIFSTETIFDDTKVEKYCYNDDSWFCENGFGGLYTWSEAMGLPKACDSLLTGSDPKCPDFLVTGIVDNSDWMYVQIQGICPDGWHLLNEYEWMTLTGGTQYVGDLMSQVFGSMDDDGLSILPAGVLNTAKRIDYELVSKDGFYWLSQEYNSIGAYTIWFSLSKWYSQGNEYKKTNGMSVRCVKDYKIK